MLGFAVCGAGWLLLALAPANAWGVAAFALMLVLFGVGAVLIFINFLALRQAVTPEPLLGRMTSTMRWLILHARPGRARCSAAGSASTSGCARRSRSPAPRRCCWRLLAWRQPLIRGVRELPKPETPSPIVLGAEATVAAFAGGIVNPAARAAGVSRCETALGAKRSTASVMMPSMPSAEQALRARPGR